MRLEKVFLPLIVFLFLTVSVHAQASYKDSHLTARDIERVRAVKELLDGIDTKSLQATIHELEKTRHPQINLEMREAMAKTYADVVKEISVEGQKKKEWLYSMVCLNMAYLQFGGGKGAPGSTSSLNRLIRQKLIKYLPVHALKQPGYFYSLE